MERSEQINELAAALVAAQAELTNPPKNREVLVKSDRGQYSFKYATLDSIFDLCRPILSRHGLTVLQTFCMVGEREGIRTMLLHQSGQFMSDESRLYSGSLKGQEFGIIVSYQRRYAYMSILGLAGEDDRDGDTGNEDKGKKSARGSAREALQEQFEALDAPDQEKLRVRATDLQEMHKRHGIISVVDELHGLNLSQEMKMALWYLLPSRIRSDIKSEEEHRRLIAAEVAKEKSINGSSGAKHGV